MPPALADSGVTITLYGRLTGLLTLTGPLTDGCALEIGEGSSSSVVALACLTPTTRNSASYRGPRYIGRPTGGLGRYIGRLDRGGGI